MERMIRNSTLITAWDEELLVGLSRSLSDFSYATYLADLAVRLWRQRQNIGNESIRRTPACIRAGDHRSAGDACGRTILRGIGFTRHPQPWRLLGDLKA